MEERAIFSALAAFIVAGLGLWWFRLVLGSIRKQPKATRYGVYLLVWLGYFILTLILISNSGSKGS